MQEGCAMHTFECPVCAGSGKCPICDGSGKYEVGPGAMGNDVYGTVESLINYLSKFNIRTKVRVRQKKGLTKIQIYTG